MKKFIAGMMFATIIAPLLDSAAAVIATGLEVVKGKWAIKVAEYNNKISQIGDEPQTSHAIGFVIPGEEEDDYEDD